MRDDHGGGMAAAARHGNPPRRSKGLSGRGRVDVAAQSYTVRYFDEPVSCFKSPARSCSLRRPLRFGTLKLTSSLQLAAPRLPSLNDSCPKNSQPERSPQTELCFRAKRVSLASDRMVNGVESCEVRGGEGEGWMCEGSACMHSGQTPTQAGATCQK
jgi:hypothetical protein